MERRRRAADAFWLRGLWLGRAKQTCEHVVRTELGAFPARNVRRLPVERRGAQDLLVARERVPLKTTSRIPCWTSTQEPLANANSRKLDQLSKSKREKFHQHLSHNAKHQHKSTAKASPSIAEMSQQPQQQHRSKCNG